MSTVPDKLLLGVSGSVAALTLPTYLHEFRVAGVKQIVAVLTTAAESFLPAASLRVICDRVYTESEPARSHVALGRWADHTLVLPATAHLLGCLAGGLAPSLLTTTLLATDGPVTLAPAMNSVMWAKPAVQRSVDTLRADGYRIAEPVSGAAFEVASQAVVPSIVVPAPSAILDLISGEAEVSA